MSYPWQHRSTNSCATNRLLCSLLLGAALTGMVQRSDAQGFENIPRTAGELIAGPIAPEQGRTAIIAWHGERIVTVPEIPGSQGGADWLMRVVDITNTSSPQVTVLPAHATGFHAHAYFHYGPYLYVGPHCLNAANNPCTGSGDLWRDSLRIGGAGTPVGTSTLRRSSMEGDAGLPIGSIDRSGTQSPWGSRDFWSYNAVSGNAFLAVRRSLAEWVYDWPNGGAPVGTAIQASWDHLAETGVIGFSFIMGNILIFAGDQTGSGVATYDISDPTNPVLLHVLKEHNPGGYWPEIYGHYLFFPRRDGEGGPNSSAGFMVVDFEDPTDLRVVANRNVPGLNQYVTFQDEYAFMNRYKIDMRTFDVVLTLATVPGVIDTSQFALPIGNLVATGGYGTDGPGLAIWAHQDAPDTRSPYVLYHVPTTDQTNYSIQCPITISIPETLRTETIVDGVSLIVQPVDGSPVQTWHSFGQGKLLTVTPRLPLLPDTTYEVILTDAIQDAAGNGLEPYMFRFSTGSGLAGGNQSPVVTSITTNPIVGTPGVPLDIDWTGVDPDGGGVEFRLDVGDGTPRSGWSFDITDTHTYAEPGHYQLTVQARDAFGAVSARTRTVTVAAPPAAPNSTSSTMMVLNSGTERLYVANPDTDTVTAFNSTTMVRLWEAPTGGHPRGIAQANDGTLWVACRDTDQLDILHPGTGALEQRIQLDYGRQPVGIAAVPGGAELLVTCEGDGTLRRFSAASRTQNAQLTVGPTPRAIAVTQNGSRALVTRFISGEHVGQVYDVNLGGSMSLTRTINLNRDRSTDGAASSRGIPNYLASIRIHPDGQWAWVAGKKDNTTRGTFMLPTMQLGADSTVRAQLMLINLATNQEDLTRRLDLDNSESPSALAFSEYGDYAFVAMQGNAMVAVVDVFDFMLQESPGTVRARWAAGIAPQSLAVNHDNGRVIVGDFLGRSISTFAAANFLLAGAQNVTASTVATVAEERLHPTVLSGKQFFYHSSDPRMSAEGYMSCATCHIDGSQDGRVFDFTDRGEGFRNTVDLRGRSGTWHGLVHWSANFDEIQDFENDIRNSFGGSGFLTNGQFAATSNPLGAPKAGLNADLDALAAYVASLGHSTIPRSSARNPDGSLTAAAVRGQDIFFAEGCATCHLSSADYTDRLAHAVGTLRESSGSRLGGPLTEVDTPTLLGIHATAPYLHNGTAVTLEDVFTYAGGRLAQAETGIPGGTSYVDSISWWPMKEMHCGALVNTNWGGTLTFNDVASNIAGPGVIEIRYNSAYGNSPLTVTVNGTPTNLNLPQTPNDPNWLPNEWRRVRVPVMYSAGMNTVVFTGSAASGQLCIDDVLFSTPDDIAAASSHLRGLSAPDLADLVEFLRSLDGTNAAKPIAVVSRTAAIAQDGTDHLPVPAGASDFTVAYTIENTGAAPLNVGQVHLDDGSPFSIEEHSAPTILPGESTTLLLRLATPPINSTALVRAWTDSPNLGELRWTIQVNVAGASSVTGFFLYE